MGFGINSVIKNLNFSRFLFQLERHIKMFFYRKRKIKMGCGCVIEKSELGNHVFLGENVILRNSSLGDMSYVNRDTNIKNTKVGKFCSIGPNVQIAPGKHPIDFVSTHPTFYSNNKPYLTFSDKLYIEEYGKVTIGNDVWIGEGVLILGGITIGNGAVVSARAIVTKNVEPYSIVGGIPAKHIRYRFDSKILNEIDESEWWNWGIDELSAHFEIFHDSDLFLSHLRSRSPTGFQKLQRRF